MATSTAPLESTESTPTRAEINRENARHSTGPKTAAGKQRVSHNALKHGAYSSAIVLPGEDRDQYTALGADLRARYNPQTSAARELVQALQDAYWRNRRISAMDINLLALATEQQYPVIDEQFEIDDPHLRTAFAQSAAFQANQRAFEQLARHQLRLQRFIEKTTAELNELRKAYRAVPKPNDSGFVPANSETPAAATTPEPPKPSSIPNSNAAPQPPRFTGPLADIKRKQWLRKNGYPV